MCCPAGRGAETLEGAGEGGEEATETERGQGRGSEGDRETGRGTVLAIVPGTDPGTGAGTGEKATTTTECTSKNAS